MLCDFFILWAKRENLTYESFWFLLTHNSLNSVNWVELLFAIFWVNFTKSKFTKNVYYIYPKLLVFSNLECESIIGTSYTNIFESDGKYLIKYLQIVFNLYFKLLKAFKNSSTHEKYLVLENNSYQRLSIIEIEIQIYHW